MPQTSSSYPSKLGTVLDNSEPLVAGSKMGLHDKISSNMTLVRFQDDLATNPTFAPGSITAAPAPNAQPAVIRMLLRPMAII